MKCPACGTEVVETSVYCHKCGERLGPGGGDGTSGSAATGADAPARASARPENGGRQTATDRFRGAVESSRSNGDVVEQELWQGGYCGKAMMGLWALSVCVTVALVVLAAIVGVGPTLWWTVLAVVVLMWGYLLLVYARRRLGVHYRLTSQRFFHEKGILVHRTDLIEVIDMDDIAYSQTILDRLFGVGTIRIASSDRSHPDLVVPGIDNVKDVAAKMHEARHAERLRRGLHIESI